MSVRQTQYSGKIGDAVAVLCAVALAFCCRVEGAPAPSAGAAPADAATNVVPIPAANIAAHAESVDRFLQTIDSDITADRLSGAVQTNLASLGQEIDNRLEENSKVLLTSQSIPELRRMSSDWQQFHDQLTACQGKLTKRVTQLEQETERLERLAAKWRATRDSTEKEQVPPELQKRVNEVITRANDELQKVKDQRTLLLTLLSQIGDLDGQASQMSAAIDRARVERLSQLFVRDRPALWQTTTSGNQNLAQASRYSFSRQWNELRAYFEHRKDRFILHGLVFLGLLGLLLWVRRSVSHVTEQNAGQERTTFFFKTPVPTALLLSLLASGWIYPQAPRLLDAIIGAAALVPAVLILRRLVDRRLFPVLDALVCLYFVDQLRRVTAAQPWISRWLFLLEMSGAALFAMWLVRKARAQARTEPEGQRLWKNINLGATFALGLFAATIVADVVGYSGLARFVGHASLSCAYLALILYAAVQILDAFIHVALRVRPLVCLGMVKSHSSLLESSVRRLLVWIAAVVWFLFALEAVSLRQPFFEDLRGLLTAKRGIGGMRFELGDVLLFVLAIWAAAWTSRIARFVLREEVYPRIQLAPGLHYSVSTMLHYAILVIGVMLALPLLGFNLQNLTILAGAFSVGLGFGLQNIVNNFVSGIILLFERPIKVGDVVQMEGAEGIVQRIGIRASIVRTPSGSEIIVPNGKLISDPVTNWTLSDRRRRIEIPVTVGAGTDPQIASEVLTKAAAAHPLVLKNPAPQVFLANPGGGALSLELRAWTDRAEEYARIRSDLALSVRTALAEQKMPAQ